MVSCLVYIGAVKDNGIHIVVPAWWQIIYYFPLCLDKHVVVSGVYRYSKNGPKVNSQPMLKKNKRFLWLIPQETKLFHAEGCKS